MDIEYWCTPRKLEKLQLERLADLCLSHGFTRRGKAFFRVHGDGVLQTIKFEYERAFSHYVLMFSIDSMYSSLSDAWFSSQRCPINQTIVSLVGSRDAVQVYLTESNEVHFRVILPSEQLDILENIGLLMMDSVDTQAKLSAKLIDLNKIDGGSIIWNDPRKICPYLMSNDYENAERVVCAILRQHICAYQAMEKLDICIRELPWTKEDILYYMPWFKSEDDELLRIYYWIINKDTIQIQRYLKENYERNYKKAKFCIKGK